MQVPVRFHSHWVMLVFSLAVGFHCQFAEGNLLSLQQSGLFGDFCGTPLGNNSIECNVALLPDVSPSYQRQSADDPYPLLLGVFIRITFMDYRKFPLNQAFILSPKCLPVPGISLHSFLPSHLPPPRKPTLIPTCSQHTHKNLFYFLFPGPYLPCPQTHLLYVTTMGLQIIACLSFT